MMRKFREDPSTSMLFLAGFILLIGAAFALLFMPQPSVAAAKAANDKAEREARAATKLAEDEYAAAMTYVAAHTWADPQEIAPSAHARVAQLAAARGLKLIAFRPQRLNERAQPPQLPFQVTVEGGYPQVMEFVRTLEAPGTKLAVNQLSVTSSDGATDRVTGNVNVVAYLLPDQEAK
jgi:hypothetical protein